MINFWPDMDLDSYINLKGRVETRMKALVMTSTGDDNLLSPEEQGDLEYRREQLKRLQTEVVDLEEMGTGVSITDLGLNEFRMEVMEYAKHHPELENTPGGISAVTQAQPDAPAGVIFVLKNVHNEVNINDRNRLHPYYLVYLTEEGEIVYDHLSPRSTLETMRQLCHGKTEPLQALCRAFNEETRCGEEMQLYSDLLEDAGIGNASVVVAATDDDNINCMLAQMARRIYDVGEVFARLNDTDKEHLIGGLNIKAIYPARLSIEKFKELSSIAF